MSTLCELLLQFIIALKFYDYITLKLTSVVIRQLYSSSETGLSLASGLQSRAHREKGLELYSDKLKSNLNICINIRYFFQALN